MCVCVYTDLCVEDGEGLCRVQWDENTDQELLVLGFQGQSKTIDDTGGGEGEEEEEERWEGGGGGEVMRRIMLAVCT